MRDAYHVELDALTEQLVEMSRLVGSAISRASTALLDADLTLAESVIVADDAVDRIRDDLDRRAIDLLARQQPVASDLRTIVTGPDPKPYVDMAGTYADAGYDGVWFHQVGTDQEGFAGFAERELLPEISGLSGSR